MNLYGAFKSSTTVASYSIFQITTGISKRYGSTRQDHFFQNEHHGWIVTAMEVMIFLKRNALNLDLKDLYFPLLMYKII